MLRSIGKQSRKSVNPLFFIITTVLIVPFHMPHLLSEINCRFLSLTVSISDSPLHTPVTSSSAIDSPLSSSITPLLFHRGLKSIFRQIFPTVDFFSSHGSDFVDSYQYRFFRT